MNYLLSTVFPSSGFLHMHNVYYSHGYAGVASALLMDCSAF